MQHPEKHIGMLQCPQEDLEQLSVFAILSVPLATTMNIAHTRQHTGVTQVYPMIIMRFGFFWHKLKRLANVISS